MVIVETFLVPLLSVFVSFKTLIFHILVREDSQWKCNLSILPNKWTPHGHLEADYSICSVSIEVQGYYFRRSSCSWRTGLLRAGNSQVKSFIFRSSRLLVTVLNLLSLWGSDQSQWFGQCIQRGMMPDGVSSFETSLEKLVWNTPEGVSSFCIVTGLSTVWSVTERPWSVVGGESWALVMLPPFLSCGTCGQPTPPSVIPLNLRVLLCKMEITVPVEVGLIQMSNVYEL